MLDITSDDIARLNDEQLRAVVARLCEAEVRGRGLSASCVTWGGHPTAPDGGIDVRVSLPVNTTIDGYIPRPSTGFQVKQQDMPRSAVMDEMRPKDVIRPSIQKLADDGGAYIIVSSDGSVADSALTDRRNAMAEALTDVPNGQALLVDFYDRTRIATWVGSHEGLIPWVRALVGRPIHGWQSYGPWAGTTEYFFDDTLRIHPVNHDSEQGLAAVAGIESLRQELHQPRHVVRLVGLSGVGKTRLVQALFDAQVGQHTLDPALAFYTNMADEPDPTPVAFASMLVTAQTRGIIVVDNCPRELHHRLSEICRQHQSNTSLITIEYDIRDDETEGTEVYKLESSSPQLIERLIRQRFPAVSQVDVHTVAEFSGGNARIAIALATTIEHHGSLAGLNDEQLFRRLFQQRHEHDDALYKAAQTCALVYSFQGTDVSINGELMILATIVEMTTGRLYGHIAELQRRDLVQQRSVWRAVMPHAIANRLAKRALQSIPPNTISIHLLSSARLQKSFSRRLGYLHDSAEAVCFVKQWLAPGGRLGNPCKLTDDERKMFKNVAPAEPEAALGALERVLVDEQTARECKPYASLLRSLAYDAALFDRCIELLVLIATVDDVNPQAHASQLFTSLFMLILSGTLAPIEQRLRCIDSLLTSPDSKRQTLGVFALRAALEALHFLNVSSYDFGARSRDYGYWPPDEGAVQDWFRSALQFAKAYALRDIPIGGKVRNAVAEQFRGLWMKAGIPDEISDYCQTITRHQFWPEGWLAVRQALDLDGKSMPVERREQLVNLEHALRPTNLADQVRSVVLSKGHQEVDLDEYEDHTADDISARIERTEQLARDLGAAVADDEPALQVLLPVIVASAGRLWSLGVGLARGTTDPKTLWERLISAFAASNRAERPLVFTGFLHGLRQADPTLTAALLDEALEHPILAKHYPYLQTSVPLEAADVARLKRSVAIGLAPAMTYRSLIYGRSTDPVPPNDLRELLLAIAAMPSGVMVAVEILHMRFDSDQQRKEASATELIQAGRDLLQQLPFSQENDHDDYKIGGVARSCLGGNGGAAVATNVCARLKAAIEQRDTSGYYHDDLIAELLSSQPAAALDALCAGNEQELNRGIAILRNASIRKPVLAATSDDALIDWCSQQADVRYKALAPLIALFQAGKTPPQWTSIAKRFLEQSPEPATILREFVNRFDDENGVVGSAATIAIVHLPLLEELTEFPALVYAVIAEKKRLQTWIDETQQQETTKDHLRDERFE